MPTPTILDSNEDHLIARWEQVTFCVWKRKTTLAAIEICCRSYRACSDNGKRPAVAFGVIFEHCAIPPADVRRAITESFDNPEHNLHAVLAVVEGRGLGASAKRTALSAMSVLTQKSVVCQSVASIEDGVDYAVARMKEISKAQLLAAAQDVMSQARNKAAV